MGFTCAVRFFNSSMEQARFVLSFFGDRFMYKQLPYVKRLFLIPLKFVSIKQTEQL